MTKLKVELEVFSNWSRVGEDGESYPVGHVDEAIILAAAKTLLESEVPVEEEPDAEGAGDKPTTYRRVDKLRAKLEEKIEEAIGAKVGEVVMAELEAEVRKAVSEGWPTTNQYGEPTGQRVTLKKMALDFLSERDSSYRVETRLQKLVQQTVEQSLSTVFKEELEKARVGFKAQVDGVLQAKLREMLASSLGLNA